MSLVSPHFQHGGTLGVFWAPATFDTLRILMVRCSQTKEVLSFATLEGSLLRTFEEGGVLITEHTRSLSVGHRREKLFDWYFPSTSFIYLLVDAVSGCRNAVSA